MQFYKILINNTVIDVNNIFLKWQSKHRILVTCEPSEAHFIQSSDEQHVWRVPWLNPIPEDANEFDTVEAVEISEEEYNELKTQLDSGETPIYREEIEEDNTTIDIPIIEEEPESVMTVEEMRRRLIELEATVSELLSYKNS